ncbi:TrmH family RNA methyltransferase [Candidatus Saccharibacteria bacterium]|nr:TrmH family RNA methyltransferase [Candidatus Saccharibacteria bacterium]
MNEELTADNDTRNVTDSFRGMSVEAIKARLDASRSNLHIAIENIERDFNAGTIVRNANAFNVEAVHIIGKKQWNKRGAMATDLYMHVYYHKTIDEFMMAARGRRVIGFDNIQGSVPLHSYPLPDDAVLVFGSERNGLSDEMIKRCEGLVAIEQFGSTRSVNVGVASGIGMYAWMQQHVLAKSEIV